MSFAVVQAELKPPTLDQLRGALTVALRAGGPWVPADAPSILRNSFGILVDRLAFDHAQALCGALANVGYPTVVVNHDELFDLPTPRTTNRMAPDDQGLMIYDALGRPTPVSWGAVLVIAAGYVRATRRHVQVDVLQSGGEAVPVEFVTIKQLPTMEPKLELLLEDDPYRLRINGRRFHYGYMAERMTHNAEVNFLTLVRDLVGHAPRAVVNRGAASIVDPSENVAVYPMMRCFEEELVWQVWHSTRA